MQWHPRAPSLQLFPFQVLPAPAAAPKTIVVGASTACNLARDRVLSAGTRGLKGPWQGKKFSGDLGFCLEPGEGWERGSSGVPGGGECRALFLAGPEGATLGCGGSRGQSSPLEGRFFMKGRKEKGGLMSEKGGDRAHGLKIPKQ